MITSGFDVSIMDSKIVHPWVHVGVLKIVKGKGFNVKDNGHWPWKNQSPKMCGSTSIH